MKIKFLNILAFFAFTACSTLPLACSNKDDDAENNNDKEEIEDNPVYSQEQINEWAADNIICWLCDVQTDSLTNKIVSHTPDYGLVLNSSTPTVRYTRAETYEKARELFSAWITSEASRENTIDGGIFVNMGSEGTVTFHPATGDGHVAVADIQLMRLPEISQVVFIKPEAWPENAGDGSIEQGSTWIKDGKIYVCVKDCKNNTGYLVHFITEDRPFVHHTVKYKKNFFHKTQTFEWCFDIWTFRSANDYTKGGHMVVDAIRTYLYKKENDQWVKREKAEELIKKIGAIQFPGWGDALYTVLYGKQVFFLHGDEGGNIDTTDREDGTQSHFIRRPYCRMTIDGVDSRRFRYTCFRPETVDDIVYNEKQQEIGTASNLMADIWTAGGWVWKGFDWGNLMELDVIAFDAYHTIDKLHLQKLSFK